MARPRALLLDFYGTLVHEDTTVIQAIRREVSRNAPAASRGEVARTWSSAFTALTAASHGTGFRLQRDLARMSLTNAVRYHHSAADPGSLLEASSPTGSARRFIPARGYCSPPRSRRARCPTSTAPTWTPP